MNELRFAIPLDEPPGFRADAVLGVSVFEVLAQLRDLRQMRASLLNVARCAAGTGDRRGILLLDEPEVSEARLREEWEGIRGVIKSGLISRLALVIHREGVPVQTIGQLSAEERGSLAEVVRHARQHSARSPRRPSEAFFEILRVLLIHWFRKSGPLTSKDLVGQTGFSYPTIAGTLEKLEYYLTRHSDRRIELHSFPLDAWFQLVAQAGKVRSTVGFADRSGRPRPLEILLSRLRELDRDDIAVGGIPGARHYVPGLDLIGVPRLDLVVHDKRAGGTHDFLRSLDPALKPAERGEPPQVVIHSLSRPATFFVPNDNGPLWADEVECLLDLHEARLESQALEFLDRLTPGTVT